jgi:hypothetical protein
MEAGSETSGSDHVGKVRGIFSQQWLHSTLAAAAEQQLLEPARVNCSDRSVLLLCTADGWKAMCTAGEQPRDWLQHAQALANETGCKVVLHTESIVTMERTFNPNP